MTKRLYFVSGEISGDTHGAEVMHALREASTGDIAFSGVGGPDMRKIGGERVVDWVEEAAVVGVWEVLKKYGYFREQFDRVLQEIKEWQPDAVVLIDYPGFNLRLAKALRKAGVKSKIIYYISPQVWAWNRGRIPKMAKLLDLMICIFPFEKELYEASGLPTVFGGHPMVDRLNALRTGKPRDETLIALLPGSREREISKIFPVLLDAARIMQKARPDLRFAAAAASKKLAARMEEMQGTRRICDVQLGTAYDLMQHSGCGAVASGTASLEAAFFGLPYCLVYKVAPLTYLAARMLMKVKFLGMVNILAGREIVHEFLQKEADSRLIADELLRLTNSEDARAALAEELAQATSQLGEGHAHHRAAGVILEQL